MCFGGRYTLKAHIAWLLLYASKYACLKMLVFVRLTINFLPNMFLGKAIRLNLFRTFFRPFGAFFLEENMKKLIAIITTLLFLILAGCLGSSKEPLVVIESERCIVIHASNKQMEIAEDTTLLEYMNSLKADEEISFKVANGMITSINGIDNPSDYSSCWMLYTSDEENANHAWGTVDYKGNVYGSAICGAEALTVKSGCVYIWLYQSF